MVIFPSPGAYVGKTQSYVTIESFLKTSVQFKENSFLEKIVFDNDRGYF